MKKFVFLVEEGFMKCACVVICVRMYVCECILVYVRVCIFVCDMCQYMCILL